MRASVIVWLCLRSLKWLLCIAAVGYYWEFAANKARHVNSFGHILPTTEFWIFVLPMAAVAVGLAEIAARERAGLPRPAVLRDWLPRT